MRPRGRASISCLSLAATLVYLCALPLLAPDEALPQRATIGPNRAAFPESDPTAPAPTEQESGSRWWWWPGRCTVPVEWQARSDDLPCPAAWRALALNRTLLHRVGEGFYREVFALPDEPGRVVKFAKPKRMGDTRQDERHLLEAKVLTHPKLQASPHVVHLLGRCGRTTLIAERLPWTLAEVAFAWPPPNDATLLRLAVGVASGVAALHEVGVVHADVRLGQFLVRRAGVAALNDLNRCVVLTHDRHTGASCRFHSGAARGRWRAPEEYKGAWLDRSIDVYSLGLVLASLVTGQQPFPMLTDLEARRAVRQGGRPMLLPAHCNTTLRAQICLLARESWAFHPGRRPKAADVRDRLARYLPR